MAVDLLRDDLVRVNPASTADEVSELARWAAEALERGEAIAGERPARAASGPCALCGQKPAVLACVNCERPACREDSWFMLGLCRGCLSVEEVEHAQRLRKERRPDLGVKWIED